MVWAPSSVRVLNMMNVAMIRSPWSKNVRRGRSARDAPGELTVQHQQRDLVVADHSECLDNLRGGLFLLDLLADEPLQKSLAGVVLHFARAGVELIDLAGHLSLGGQHPFEELERRPKGGRR